MREDGCKVHVVFGMAAAGTVREALGQNGCHAHVIGLPDDLSFGPIATSDPQVRAQAVEEIFGIEWDEIVSLTELFWEEATRPTTLPVAWVCRNHASEFSGFLEFLHRIASVPFEVIDLTDAEVPLLHDPQQTFKPWSLGILYPEQIVSARLFERQDILTKEEKKAYRATWRALQTEDAPFRTVGQFGLVSAPLNFYDDVLIACASADWQPAALIVGKAMGELYDRPFNRSPSDLVLWGRTRALAGMGLLEMSGNGTELRGSFVRLKPAS